MNPPDFRSAVCAAFAFLPVVAFADDFAWNSSAAGNWTNTSLWYPAGTTPASSDNLISPLQLGTMRLAGIRTVANITVDIASASWTIQGAQGSTTTGGLIVTHDITKTGAGNFIIGAGNSPTMDSTIGGNISSSGGGALTFNGDQTKTMTVTVQGTSTADGGNIGFGNGLDTPLTNLTLGGLATVKADSIMYLRSLNSVVNGISVEANATLATMGTIKPQGGTSVLLHAGGEMNVVGNAGLATVTVLDGAGTSGPILSAEAGAVLALNFMNDGTSEAVNFYNYTGAADFVMNGLVIDADGGTGTVGLAPGAYTLFSFYADSGLTPIASGITEGLVLGSGFDGFTASLDYSQLGRIVLNVDIASVPEPSTLGLLVLLGSFGVVLARRRGRAQAA